MPANQRAANLFDGRRAHAFGTKGPIVTRGTVPTRTKPYQRQLITRRRSSCKYRARSNATHRLAELVKCNVIGIVSSNCCTIPIRMEINSGSRIVLSTNSKGPFAVTYVIDTVGSGQNERFVNQRPRTIVQFRVRVTNRPDRRKVAGLRPIDDPTEKLIRLLPIFGNILAHTVITGKSVLASIFVVLIYRDQQFANIGVAVTIAHQAHCSARFDPGARVGSANRHRKRAGHTDAVFEPGPRLGLCRKFMLLVAAHVAHIRFDLNAIGRYRATVLYLGKVDHVGPADCHRRANAGRSSLGGLTIGHGRIVLIGKRTERHAAVGCVDLAGHRSADVGFDITDTHSRRDGHGAVGGLGFGRFLRRAGTALILCFVLLVFNLFVNSLSPVDGASRTRFAVGL